MANPDAVHKHDGRSVAFDPERLEASVIRAATELGATKYADALPQLARQVATAVSAASLAGDKRVVATAEIRALAIKALRELKHDGIADAYQNHARAASQLLWRVRVVEAEAPRTSSSGSPWDRRRLLESLRASGVAFDVAGAAAREVERRIVALGQEFISPALIHSLALLALPADARGAKAYGVRRVAFSAAAHLPNSNAAESVDNPLPSGGAALEQFWLQGVHSPEVVKAARDNFLSLDPYPSSAETLASGETAAPIDPLALDFTAELQRELDGNACGLNVRTDGVERIAAVAGALAQLAQTSAVAARGTELSLYFKALPKKHFDPALRAVPITINAGGAVARETMRDARRAAARLSALVELAARAHAEREEYFLRSPVRGRVLPIAVAGLWNATAWIQGENFDATLAARGARAFIAPLCDALRSTVQALRTSSGADLVLTAATPPSAKRRLWAHDRGHFLRDGTELNAASAYASAPELKLSSAAEDFINRLDFAKALSEAFDEPPELSLTAPLAPETTAAQWSELFESLAKAGVARLRLTIGGPARTVQNLSRAVRSYLVGFPLLDNLL